MQTCYLTTVAHQFQGNMVQEVLRNEGIESVSRNGTIATIFGHTPGFQTDIYVFEEDYARARTLLESAFPELLFE